MFDNEEIEHFDYDDPDYLRDLKIAEEMAFDASQK